MTKLTVDVLEGFVNTILSKNYENATAVAPFHKEWWELCLSDAPNVAIAAPRGHSKSTSITYAYALAMVLFRQSRYMLIVSDTEGQAVNFLGQITVTLQENNDIRELFGIQKFVKSAATEIIVEFTDGEQFRIEAKGAEQKVRGLSWRNTRPDLIICDDLENDEIVMNKERRERFRQWFMNALMQCRSSNGKIRLVGTVLHMDSLLERLLPKPWVKSTIKTPLVTKFGKDGLGPGGWLAARYRAHSDDFKHILWKDRNNREYFEKIRNGYISQGYPEGYTQEYLNIPIDETSAYFKRGDFVPMTPEDFNTRKRYYAACDLAISESDRADYTVFAVAGVDEHGTIHLEKIIRERMDAHQIIKTILAVQSHYEVDLFGIESGAIQKSIGPFLKQEMHKTGIYPNIMELVPSKDKEARARSIQARLRAGGIKFNKDAEWYPAFEDELARFPRDVHDDQVDALSWIGLMLDKLVEAPTIQELEEEEWEEEMENSELFLNDGRNFTTGY